MLICGVGQRAAWAALLLLTTSPLAAALANETGIKLPSAVAAPLANASLEPKSDGVQVESAPTGALKSQPTRVSQQTRPISKLDLSPAPGLLPDLPPEAEPPSFSEAPLTHVAAPATPGPGNGAAAEIGASSSGAPAAPAALAQPEFAPRPPPTPVGDGGRSDPPSTERTTPNGPAPADISPSTPGGSAPSPAVAGNALADEIQAALNRFAIAASAGCCIGAGNWSDARKAIATFYAGRSYAPLWIDGDHLSASAKSALARLAKADEDGLDLADLPLPRPDWEDRSPSAQAEADIEISAAVVVYAMQATGARINPAALSRDISAKPEVADPTVALENVAKADDADAALAAFNPPQAGYRALRVTLAEMRDEVRAAMAQFSPGPVLKLGMSDPRVPLIRARLGLSPLSGPSSSQIYDVRVASAVAAFQRVHGLPVDGSLTEATASALDRANVRERREQLILANMEMWRWEPREMGQLRVEVNVPDFSLKLINGDSIIRRARVVVGKPETPTPIFSNSIKYMLFNPVWRVPDSIVKKEMAPRYAADPGYFARHGYKVSYVGDKLVVEQQPGEENALGRMLFLFPNEHAVYLHDTPLRSVFSAPYRALSHGCVRVEDPAKLAEILMGGAPRGWTDAKVRSVLGDKERAFSLPTPVPIHLQYFTEFVDENGVLREREDLYGLTRKVAFALAKSRRD